DDADRHLVAFQRAQLEQESAHADAIRMAKLAKRTQTTMADFLKRATAHKIDRLSELATDSFRFLLHKQTLVKRVCIDPESFCIDLYDESGNKIPKGRLSEG